MRALLPGLALGAALGCSSARYGSTEMATVTLPTHFAEGTSQSTDAGAAPSAPSLAPSGAPAHAEGDAPDPDPPLRTASQWEYLLHYEKGAVRVASVHHVQLDRPVLARRVVGRFAFELWIGKELVERVRFDFPLLAADLPPEGKKRPLRDPPRFGPGADTSAQVTVPASDRATSAVLVDRLTGSRTAIPWPPEASTEPAPESPTKTEPAKSPATR